MSNVTEKHIRELWQRMGEIYGHRWTSGFGELDNHNTWLTGLENLTPEMLAQGLRGCVNRQDPWPPTLPEFRAMCLDFPEREEIIHIAIYEPGNHTNRLSNMVRHLIGNTELNNSTYDKLERRARSVYPEAVKRITNFMLSKDSLSIEDLNHHG